VTRWENLTHAIINDLVPINVKNWVYLEKEVVPRKKKPRSITDEIAEEMRLLVIGGMSYEGVAEKYGQTKVLVYTATHGRNGYKVLGETPTAVRAAKNKEIREKKAADILVRKAERYRRKHIKADGIVKLDYSELIVKEILL